jgi:hypothetical protein
MTKKNIQVVLAILVLTALIVGGLYYFNQQKKNPLVQPTVKTPTAQVATTSFRIDEVKVDERDDKVALLVKRVNKYRVRFDDDKKGFTLVFPNTSQSLNQTEWLEPHPWIQSIRVESQTFRGQPSVEIAVRTIEDLAFFDQFQNNQLTMEFQNTKMTAAPSAQADKKPKVAQAPKPTRQRATPAPKPKPAAKPAPKPAPKPKPVVVPTPAPKPKPTPLPDPEPIELDQPEPMVDTSNDFNDFPVIDDSELNSLDALPDDFQALDDTNDFEVNNNQGNTQDDVMDVMDDFGGDEEVVSLMDLETSFSLEEDTSTNDDVAMVDPSDGKFDMGTVEAQASKIQAIEVGRESGKTKVVFRREQSTPYKVFKLANPSRIAVDFKDAKSAVNENWNLAGTSIDRIETQEFANGDSSLVRVLFYLNTAPEYAARKEGTSLVIELP